MQLNTNSNMNQLWIHLYTDMLDGWQCYTSSVIASFHITSTMPCTLYTKQEDIVSSDADQSDVSLYMRPYPYGACAAFPGQSLPSPPSVAALIAMHTWEHIWFITYCSFSLKTIISPINEYMHGEKGLGMHCTCRKCVLYVWLPTAHAGILQPYQEGYGSVPTQAA